jgi:hypothetical protein
MTLLGQRIQNTGRVHIFPLPDHVFIFFLEIYFKAHIEKNLILGPFFTALISVLKEVILFGASK